ncbi:MAG: carboxyl transferase domain-containing protein [Pseudomonadota bacterium]
MLIANRGEIALRILRSCHRLQLETVAIHTPAEARARHVVQADQAVQLTGSGVQPYLDVDAVVTAATKSGCDVLHPGYGLLSENPLLAEACEAAGIYFIGPSVATLKTFGDKAAARSMADRADVPILPGINRAISLSEAEAFLAETGHSAVIIKAIAGGGGRGVRVVRDPAELEAAYLRCQSEAANAFGSGDLYIERYLPEARHLEVQILGDRQGNVIALGERDCSLQRRHQKLVEITPAPDLAEHRRTQLYEDAVRLAQTAGYEGAGTVEFLVNADEHVFIELNARLQVEHTITEEVFGVDIVASQIRLAAGEQLVDLGLTSIQPRGTAIQIRINSELLQPDGILIPQTGKVESFNPPMGPGVRLDTHIEQGFEVDGVFDSLLAKLIIHEPDGDWSQLHTIAKRRLDEFQLSGVATNISFLKALLEQSAVGDWQVHTQWVDSCLPDILDGVPHTPMGTHDDVQSGLITSPLQGTVIELSVAPGDTVAVGQTILILEAMKMEHEIKAATAGTISTLFVELGATTHIGEALVQIEIGDVAIDEVESEHEIDLDSIRSDLAEVEARRETTLDSARAQAVERRRAKQQRTARENVADLCDVDTFVEYGQLVLADQRRRRTLEQLIEKSPADGFVTGVGSVNGEYFDDPDNRCVIMCYDYTVFAGTQGAQSHRKTDRMINVAEDGVMPVVLFAEGGGGRPGDGLRAGDSMTFARFAQLSGLVPLVGITSGYCFAGNASLLGCCDVVIATEDSNIGMGGPAMIEGGGLGVYKPEDVGPTDVQVGNGVIDVLVADEAEAVTVAKQYLSYFQGPITTWQAPDQRRLRHVVPENRMRIYDIKEAINILADEDSVLYLREGWGHGMVTALVRIEGRPVGLVANNPKHLGGAIDADGADKAARFMQLCDAFDLPLVFLCDTPGIMVGPEIEKTALVRHASRMFLTGANVSVPFFSVILRKAYGLGAIAMAGGSWRAPNFSVSWPTGEFGGMGLEGSVKLGYRAELEAIEDSDDRQRAFEEMVARAYEKGKALNNASLYTIDDTIDPAQTRFWLANLLKSMRRTPRTGKKRGYIDAW